VELLPAEKLEPILIKLILTNSKYLILLGSCKYESQWLTDQLCGNIINLIQIFYTKFQKIPSIQTLDLMVSKKYPDKYTELSLKLKNINSIDLGDYQTEYLDEQIILYLQHAGFYWTIMSSIDDIQSKHNIEKYLEDMRRISSMTFDKDIGLDYLDNIDSHIDYLTTPENRLSTGWSSLDNYTNGGYLRDGRCLAVFLGETHIGKSLVLSNTAANLIKEGKFVLIISLEMSKDVYASRIDAHLTSVDINSLKDHTTTIKKHADAIKLKYPKAKLLIKEFPPDSVSCNHLKTYIDEVIETHKRTPDIIIIDYINLLVPNGKFASDNSYNKYKDVATQMRALTYFYNIPIVSCSQVNRSGFSSTDIGLDKTSESMGIPFTADFVGVLWQNEGDREAEILNIKILKNRFGGRIGKNLQFHIDYKNLIISDILKTNTASEIINDVLNDIEEV